MFECICFAVLSNATVVVVRLPIVCFQVDLMHGLIKLCWRIFLDLLLGLGHKKEFQSCIPFHSFSQSHAYFSLSFIAYFDTKDRTLYRSKGHERPEGPHLLHRGRQGSTLRPVRLSRTGKILVGTGKT